MLLGRAAALTTGVIVPLYLAPLDNCAAWSSMISAASNHPSLPFYFVVNPSSGPGGINTQPDTNTQACVPQLRLAGNPNVKLLGYVWTDYANRDPVDVKADVATYAQWNSAYHVDGIFYDGTSYNNATRYEDYTSYAKAQIPNAFVTLNPGISAIDNKYYEFADQIVTVEKYFNDFNSGSYVIGPSTPASKQAVILHDSPSFPTSTINQLVKDKIGAIYITDDSQTTGDGNPYDSFPTYWSSFLSAIEAASK